MKEIVLENDQIARRSARHHSGIVLAAGSSRRMGAENKLVRFAQGEPLIRRVVKIALASRLSQVIVAVPAHDHVVAESLVNLPICFAHVNNPDLGMSASLMAGIRACGPTDSYTVLLGDMPDIKSGHVDLLLDAFAPEAGKHIVLATDHTGQAGHPVVFDARLTQDLLSLSGDIGARDVIAKAGDAVTKVSIGRAATCDLDTPEAWIKWEANQ